MRAVSALPFDVVSIGFPYPVANIVHVDKQVDIAVRISRESALRVKVCVYINRSASTNPTKRKQVAGLTNVTHPTSRLFLWFLMRLSQCPLEFDTWMLGTGNLQNDNTE